MLITVAEPRAYTDADRGVRTCSRQRAACQEEGLLGATERRGLPRSEPSTAQKHIDGESKQAR